MIYARTYNCNKEPWLIKNKPESATMSDDKIIDIYASDKDKLKLKIDILMKEYTNLDVNNYNDSPENLVKITLDALNNNENILIKNGYLKNMNNDYYIKYDYLLKKGNEYSIFIIIYKELDKAVKDYTSKLSLVPKYLYTKDILRSNLKETDTITSFAIDLVEKEFSIDEINDTMFSSKDLNKILYEKLEKDEDNCEYSRKCKKCQYRNYCGVPEFSVADLENTPNCWRILDPIIKSNKSLNLDDLTENQINSLNKLQLAKYKAYKSDNGIYYDKNIINSFLDKVFERGYISFDFETYSSLIAFNDNYKNYSQIPFSFSYDLIDKNNIIIEHKVFVVNYKDDNFDSLAEELAKTVPIDLPIVVYYQSFEKTRLKELAELYPSFGYVFETFQENLLDLYDVFAQGGYYDMKFKNSLSLKSVYPTLCESNDYENLDINHGDDCAIQYKELFNSKKEEGADALINSIKKYNSKDTMAQIEIIDRLKNIIKYENK